MGFNKELYKLEKSNPNVISIRNGEYENADLLGRIITIGCIVLAISWFSYIPLAFLDLLNSLIFIIMAYIGICSLTTIIVCYILINFQKWVEYEYV